MIKSKSENDAVLSVRGIDPGYNWLGAKRVGNKYFWLDGTEVAGFTNWRKEPTYHVNGIDMGSDGKWTEEYYRTKPYATVSERPNELKKSSC